MKRSLIVTLALAGLAGGCDTPPDETETTANNIVVGAETPVNTRNMLLLAKAAICGPEIWGPGVGGFPFASKKATINNFDGTITFAAGQLSHIINFWPDDQIYYTIPYEGGMPKKPDIQITHGGVAAWLKVIANVVDLLGLNKIKIDKEVHEFQPDKLPEIATGISLIVQGKGWEAQAAAIIDLIGVTATKGNMICSFQIL
jgi:hypothetical protein